MCVATTGTKDKGNEMTTALLILAAVVLVVLLVAVFAQMCESPVMWVFHMVCGTPAALCNLLALILDAIVSGFRDE